MLWEYAKACIIVVALFGAWVWVQAAWRKTFARPADDDVLAGRGGCHSCTCEQPCENKTANAPAQATPSQTTDH